MTSATSPADTLAARSGEYLTFLETWVDTRPTLDLESVTASAGGPERVAVVAVDLTNGFCHQGPLASPRVAALLPRVATLLTRAYELGVRRFALPQDTHARDAQEFASYPAHCLAGDVESLTAPELLDLPFAHEFTVLTKNSLSSTIDTGFDEWEAQGGAVNAYIIVGDCTDLCVYQAAMALKLRSNAAALGTRVIVPADCVDTFDLPVATAREIGAQPHPGDLYHSLFLHSMAANGVEVVATLR